MCGIAGFIDKKRDVKILQAMLKRQSHRGPDDSGVYIDAKSGLYLGHNRLAIQDLSFSAHQPFISRCKQYVIIFNGEIYNHLELRKTLLREYEFSTTSDTETLLYMYIKFGSDMFAYLDGMFAFCILDKVENHIFLAKDRAGKKPLYIYRENGAILFASEINTIKAGAKNLQINKEAIASYLRNGFFFCENSAFKNLTNLKAGHYAILNIETLEINSYRYFDILDFYNKPSTLSFEETLEEIDTKLHKSIKDRLESSDLEVGAFLSGGIDSSLIVAIASSYQKSLKTFTVKFSDGYDESHLARLTANKYHTHHHELGISMHLKDDIETILCSYGQPFMDSSAIPSYYVSKEAKKYVTVILNGDGADEIFGGYRRYVPAANGLLGVASRLSFLAKVMPKPHNKQSLYNYLYRLLAMANKKGLDFYASSTGDIFEDEYIFDKNSIDENMDNFITKVNLDPLSKMLYLDFNMLLFSDLLVKMDIATMRHSLEARSPFLSKYMLEFAPTIQNRYKIKGSSTKHILRQLAKKYLSNELIMQPKRGFEVPLKKWVENELKENIFDSLSQDSFASEFIEKKFIDNLLNRKINVSEEKRAKMLWSMYCLEVWKKNL